MRRIAVPLLILIAGSGLQAQSPHIGFNINLLLPTGAFRSVTYPPTLRVRVPQDEGYDFGLGGSFHLSFPIERSLAFRLSFGFASTNGSNTAAGYDKINLRHTQFNLGGEFQIFPNQTAYRHKGFYFLGGASADFERFDRSFGDPGYDFTDTTRKSRMGLIGGVGHSFGYDAGTRFTLELAYHKTITGNKASAGDPPNTDYLKASFGWVF